MINTDKSSTYKFRPALDSEWKERQHNRNLNPFYTPNKRNDNNKYNNTQKDYIEQYPYM